MSDEPTYEPLELVGIHETEIHRTRHDDGRVTEEELPGIYRVGAMRNGVFVELLAVKGGVLTNSAAAAAGLRRDERERLQREREQEQAAQPPPTGPLSDAAAPDDEPQRQSQ